MSSSAMSQNEAFINKCKELRDCYYTGDGDIYVIKRMIALNHDTLTSVTPLHIPDTLTRIVFPQSNPFISSQWKKCKICRDIRCNKSEKKKHTGNHVEWIQHFNSLKEEDLVEKENSSELPLDTNSGQISNFVNVTPGSQDRRLKYHADLDIGIMKQMQKNAEFRARMNVITKKCKKNLYPQVFVE